MEAGRRARIRLRDHRNLEPGRRIRRRWIPFLILLDDVLFPRRRLGQQGVHGIRGGGAEATRDRGARRTRLLRVDPRQRHVGLSRVMSRLHVLLRRGGILVRGRRGQELRCVRRVLEFDGWRARGGGGGG